ncbi:hypothetical protein DQ04_04271030 [Trypanosoma grayi]|uniref:hypothetical protein n=1 Tax=Trypanosoma grayi TaxID=71804 RepID=UPI0004F40931|nr:hypothetical protein DQ04_04271030 [Trypanosoma grayi]KEG10035.1 hypothetical protein DQ04_04271030 [Trypanosoma grayi]
MLDELIFFFYGWILGAVAVPVFYLYGSDNLARIASICNSVLLYLYKKLTGRDIVPITFSRASYRNSIIGDVSVSTVDFFEREHPQQQQQPGGSGVSPVRLTSVCQMAWYGDSDAASVAQDIRLVLFDSFLMVYEVGASQSVGSHDRVITFERLRGRVKTGRVSVRTMFIESSSRRTSHTGALHGHVLLISANDDGPLFEDSDAGGGGEGKKAAVPLSGSGSGSRSNGSSKKKSDRNTSAGSVAPCESEGSSVTRHTMVLKFYHAREQERWLNLLEGPREAAHWRAYLQTLTTPDAFNLFLTRLLFQNLRTTALANFIRSKIQAKLHKLSVTKFPREIEGEIIVKDFVLGEEVPIFSNVTAPTVTEKGEMGFEFDLLYRGGAILSLLLNLTYRGIRIPHVVISVKIVRLAARIHMSVGPPPSKTFWLGGLAPPDVRVEVHQGIESGRGLLHLILTSLPDLSNIATNLIKLYLIQDMVLPVMDDFPLPNVEKTPQGSPSKAGKKSWNTRFDRQNAAARSRVSGDVLRATQPSAATGASPVVAAAADAATLAVNSSTYSNSPHPSPASLTVESSLRCLDESGTLSSSRVTGENPSCSANKSPRVSSTLPPNSEDARRSQIKVKAREIMRLPVRCASGLPAQAGADPKVKTRNS